MLFPVFTDTWDLEGCQVGKVTYTSRPDTRYTALNFTWTLQCNINNTMNSNFSFYFIITKFMRHEFVFKDNNKIKQIGRVFMH